MSMSAMPASEPSKPACGITRRTVRPANESPSLMTPMTIVAAMPRCQVCSAAACGSSPSARKWLNAGPSTSSVMPMVEGVSSPNGRAVTSLRPLRRARRTASHV